VKTSPKRSYSLNRKRAFWLVFAKTGSIISGTGESEIELFGTATVLYVEELYEQGCKVKYSLSIARIK
jgi:hypothetical protein